jgi:hypothetical protein
MSCVERPCVCQAYVDSAQPIQYQPKRAPNKDDVNITITLDRVAIQSVVQAAAQKRDIERSPAKIATYLLTLLCVVFVFVFFAASMIEQRIGNEHLSATLQTSAFISVILAVASGLVCWCIPTVTKAEWTVTGLILSLPVLGFYFMKMTLVSNIFFIAFAGIMGLLLIAAIYLGLNEVIEK